MMTTSSPSQPPAADRPIPDLLMQFSAEVGTLVRKEMELARTELTAKSKEAGKSAGFFGATALFGVAAFAALTIALVAAIALALPVWAAALIVAVVYGVIAAVTAITGKASLKNIG